ncbi:MAG: Inositol-1-monophosphatase [Bacteroidetes bacterium ADurb.Bin408]|nr:MAG: Inositol-1-monophosphatase [Bacteroidetes bacterium ADurb.Bin408]
MRNDHVVLGVVYEINLGECFYAWEGGKAMLNGREINVTQASRLKDSLFATGFPYYDYQYLDEYMDFFKFLMLESRGVRRLGSAAVDLAYVACGRFEGFYEYSLNPWDVAAGAFIVQQAGGKVCDFNGKNDYIFGAEIIAANPYIIDTILVNLQKYFLKKTKDE